MAEVSDAEFERVFGGKPPAKLEFYATELDLYHRIPGVGWQLYDRDSNPESERQTSRIALWR